MIIGVALRNNFAIYHNVEATRENEKEVVIRSSLANDRLASLDFHYFDQACQLFSQSRISRYHLLDFERVNQSPPTSVPFKSFFQYSQSSLTGALGSVHSN